MSLNPELLLPESIDPEEFARLLEQRELFEATELAGRFGHCHRDSRTLRLMSCSEGYARLFDMTRAEVYERLSEWDELLIHIHPDDRERYAETYGVQLSAGTYSIDYRIAHADGKLRWIHEVSILKADDSNTAGPRFSILQDITEQVEREQKLLNSDDLTDQIEAVTDLGHFIFDDENDHYLYVSPGYARIHGITQEAYLQRSSTFEEDLLWVHEEDHERVRAELKQYSTTDGKDYSSEYRIVRPNGEVAWVREKSVSRMTINNRVTQTVGVLQDITATKQHEQELREARDSLEQTVNVRTRQLSELVARLQRENSEREKISAELERKNAELERFAYTVSHDLKTPLITINGLLGLITKDLSSGNSDSSIRYIERVNDATTSMAHMLEELLELSRIGHVIGQPTPCDLAELAQVAVNSLEYGIAERGVEIEIEDMPTADVDRVRMIEVYQNLVENAVRFMGDQPSPRIRIGTLWHDTGFCFFVRDNGIGMAPEYLEKVFGLFERLKTRTAGTGIGLALVKRIIEVHGGEAWIESAGLGQGITVYFTLPSSDRCDGQD